MDETTKPNFFAQLERKMMPPDFFFNFLFDLRISAKICVPFKKVFYV